MSLPKRATLVLKMPDQQWSGIFFLFSEQKIPQGIEWDMKLKAVDIAAVFNQK